MSGEGKVAQFLVDVDQCSACGMRHARLLARPRPEPYDRAIAGSHFTVCPSSGRSLFIVLGAITVRPVDA